LKKNQAAKKRVSQTKCLARQSREVKKGSMEIRIPPIKSGN